MGRRTKVVGAVSAVAVAAGVAAIAASRMHWRRVTRREVMRLQEAARALGGAAPEPAAAQSPELPVPVARYFALALPANLTRIRAARITWTGKFQMRPGSGWRPFEAEQHFTTQPPGFVWDARIRMLPLVPVHVRDRYVSGEGNMLGKVAGLVTVVDEGSTPEMAAGALVRWLGEAVWFPTALLPGATPGEGVRWDPVDERTARATMTDGVTSVSAEFYFAATGEIKRMIALRYRDVHGSGELTPFEAVYRDYDRHHGVLIPMSAEVAWLLPERRFPYWRGRPVAVSYDRELDRALDTTVNAPRPRRAGRVRR